MRLPLEPLAHAIEARGGLHALLISRGIINQSVTYKTYCDAMRRAKIAGRLTVGAADKFCIRLLGLHPFEVFGDDWWPDVAA